MKRKRETLNLPADVSPVRVLVPMTRQWIPAWVVDDRLVTVACVVPKHLTVKVDNELYMLLDADTRLSLQNVLSRYMMG